MSWGLSGLQDGMAVSKGEGGDKGETASFPELDNTYQETHRGQCTPQLCWLDITRSQGCPRQEQGTLNPGYENAE